MRSRTTPAGHREHVGDHAWVRLPDLPADPAVRDRPDVPVVPDLPPVDGRPNLPDARAPSGAR